MKEWIKYLETCVRQQKGMMTPKRKGLSLSFSRDIPSESNVTLL